MKVRDVIRDGWCPVAMQGKTIAIHRYLVVIEKAGENYSAYSPDLPGCVASGATREEAERSMQDAIVFHLDGLREDSLPVPEPTSTAEYVSVP